MSELVHWNLVILFILIMLVVIVKSGDVAMMFELRFPPQIQQRRSGWIQMSEEKRWAVDGTQGQMTHSGRQSVADKGAAAG